MPHRLAPTRLTCRAPHSDPARGTELCDRVLGDFPGNWKWPQKNDEDSYHREARAIAADAAATERLSRIQGQIPLPLDTNEPLAARTGEAVRDVFRRALMGADKAKPRDFNVKLREDDAVITMGNRIALYAAELAEKAFHLGYQAREAEPEVIADACLSALKRDAA